MPNIISFIVVNNVGILLVDLYPIESELQWTALLSCLLAILISTFFLYKACTFGSKIISFFAQTKSLQINLLGIGFIVGILQLLGIVAVMLYGYGVAGISSSEVTPNFIIRLISYISPDSFFLIYYGQVRGEKKPYINIVLYLISATLRGWSGAILVILLIEFFYQLLKLSFWKIFVKQVVIIILILSILPLIFATKTRMRGGEADVQSVELSALMLFNRLQHYTNVCMIAQNHSSIENSLNKHEILPYYQDNEIGSRLARVDSQSIQSYLVDNFLVPDFLYKKVSWHTHTGIAGWLYLLSIYEIPIYFLYLLLIILLPYIIVAILIKDRGVIPILHMLSVFYVFHGWFSVQVNLIISIFLYACICKLMFIVIPSRVPLNEIIIAK